MVSPGHLRRRRPCCTYYMNARCLIVSSRNVSGGRFDAAPPPSPHPGDAPVIRRGGRTGALPHAQALRPVDPPRGGGGQEVHARLPGGPAVVRRSAAAREPLARASDLGAEGEGGPRARVRAEGHGGARRRRGGCGRAAAGRPQRGDPGPVPRRLRGSGRRLVRALEGRVAGAADGAGGGAAPGGEGGGAPPPRPPGGGGGARGASPTSPP